MRRLNVQFTQIEECIRTALFAVDSLPRNPPLERGEALLLQLVKQDAVQLGKLDRRVEFALIFEKAHPDPTGTFDMSSMAFSYPNGLVERLLLRDHLLD